jgi:acetyltransferase-like isoleucine patch superfamily enzyme
MTLRSIAKRPVQALALLIAIPSALVCGFGKWQEIYRCFTHCYALLPGMPGSYLRAAFYKLTLKSCSIDITIGFGTIFVYPNASVEPLVSFGCYCMLGTASIGRATQIASHVEILGGRRQHFRDEQGGLRNDSGKGIVIGSHCWIGSSAIVMASVGDRSTIGAGAVVVHDIEADAVAVGNPAKVVRPRVVKS